MNTLAQKRSHSIQSIVYHWLRWFTRSRNLAIILTIAVSISVIATYISITGSKNPLGADPRSILKLMLLDLILLLALAGIISRRLARLVAERRQGLVGSRLQTRIVVMFSLVAIVPTITMALFSAMFFNLGIQTWFDKKVSTAIEGSVAIAESYLEEHKNIIRADILGMANDLNRDAHNVRRNPASFGKKVALLAGIRKIPEAIVFQQHAGRSVIVARTNFSFALQMVLENIPGEAMKKAVDGDLVTLTSDNEDRVMALIRLENYLDAYLLVGRFVDNKIINYIETTEGAASEYKRLQSDISDLQIKFFVVFVIVSLLLLLAVVWFGFIFATNLVKPVSQLVSATDKVKGGDLSVRVPEGHVDDEVATLGRAFNRMTEQLERQRVELVSAQRHEAWSDVARRIAHEIKNPLTPIQLASERLKKKYSDKVEDQEMFSKYINTIIKNVGDIGKMVEEFVDFAKIPAPLFKPHDICALTHGIIFSREVASPKVKFIQHIPDEVIELVCDGGQIERVLTNLLKNAEESIEDRAQEDKNFSKGVVEIDLSVRDKHDCVIKIKDNGKGIPKNMMSRLTEPYVTTKSKGTGLGLAIVKKIIEDHNGSMNFLEVEEGACVLLILPLAKR